MTHPISRTKGFTLIELMVVIAIIALLATIVIVLTQSARVKAQNSRVQQSVVQYGLALAQIDSELGYYPDPAPGTAGYYCLGTPCSGPSFDSSTAFNSMLAAKLADGKNPNTTPILFNGDEYTAAYLRCVDAAECPGDDIAEVAWFLEGDNVTCALGGTQSISDTEGNSMCLYHIRGTGSLVSDAI